MSALDKRFMTMALGLARRGLGRVWPNPAVGCVIVNAGRVVGRGWTQPGGRPHAEPIALAQAGDRARGATAYVTLEPCAHHGQTPPCAEALIAAGVARVVVACRDPDPRVDGGGIAMLRAAGIAVELGLCEVEAFDVAAGFLTRQYMGRPLMTLKLATSLDGRIATATGESQWITGAEARRRVHLMRAQHDAVLVGAGTARDDDPSLTVRGLGLAQQPVRVVLSRNLDLPLTGTLAKTAREVPLWLCHGPSADETLCRAWRDLGAQTLAVPVGHGGQIDAAEAMKLLGAQGLTRVFCEGGGALAASLLGADLVDRLVLFQGGILLGAEGRPGIGALGVDRLAEAPQFRLHQTERLRPDTLHLWARNRLAPPEPGVAGEGAL